MLWLALTLQAALGLSLALAGFAALFARGPLR
jgi:hypothetical protein